MNRDLEHAEPSADRCGLAILLALAVVAIVSALALTGDGAGASGDSAFYVMGARNLLAGNGYARISGTGHPEPITGFPPFFSIVLAGFGLFGLDGFTAARYLNAFLFGANLMLAGGLIYLVGGSRWAAAIGAMLLLANFQLIQWHSWVMSEPLYIFLILLSAGCLAFGVRRKEQRFYLLAGLLAGGASLTRYIGVAMVGAGLAVILVLEDSPVRTRIRGAATFIGSAALPIAWWFVASASGEGAVANRAIIFHPMDPDLLDNYKAELIAWAFARQLPVPWRPRAFLAFLVASLGPTSFAIRWMRNGSAKRPWRSSPAASLPWLMSLYLAAHFGILAANSLFLDAATTLSAVGRYLVPAYVALVILSVSTTANWVGRGMPSRFPAIAAISLGVLLVVLHIRNTFAQVEGAGLDLGYVGVRRDFPELVAGLNGINSDQPIISNNPELVYVLIERPARPIPAEYDPYQGRTRPGYEAEVETVRALMDSGAVLVIFGEPDAGARSLMESLSVTPIAWFDTAMFYSRAASVEG